MRRVLRQLAAAVQETEAPAASPAATAIKSADKDKPGDGIDPDNYDLRRLFPARLLGNSSAGGEKKLADLLWEGQNLVISALVGVSSKLFMSCNNVTVYEVQRLRTALEQSITNKVPLITVSNHHCCLDDPLIFGAILDWKNLLNRHLMRWSLAAHDVCFTRRYHGDLFARGKIVPVVRGLGVNQPGVDFCVDRLREGAWVHVFPEGKVNLTKAPMRLKWGVGRLIADCTLPPWTTSPSSSRTTTDRLSSLPIVLPIFHLGMDCVQPNVKPYLPRFGQRVTVCVGEPINTSLPVAEQPQSEVEQRKILTDKVQAALRELEDHTTMIHCGSSQS